MSPSVETSISRFSQHRWTFGSAMICEKVAEVPSDSVNSWRDETGNIFSLRRKSDLEQISVSEESLDSESGRVHVAGTSSAV